MQSKNTVEDVWQYVQKTETCWLYTGAIEKNGYARFWLDGRKQLAHRLTYALEYGTIPDGLVIDHKCKVRNCVNPRHLEAVRQVENVRRGSLPGSTFNRGEKQGAHKLKESEVILIRQLSSSGLTQQAIADRFNVSRRLIGMIANKTRWAHVP